MHNKIEKKQTVFFNKMVAFKNILTGIINEDDFIFDYQYML